MIGWYLNIPLLVCFFSLEYVGELRIIVLRRRMIQLQNPHLTLDQNEE